MNDNNITYFDNFRVEHILKEFKKFIGNKNIMKNIFRTQANDSIMIVLELLILCSKIKVLTNLI